ncbi:N-acetylglucosamine kinase [Kamptonema formosum]|uniref:N-acetylglucosamine kinase n=1 Tax=Kamptonema formosum TaxID=331992 RepID=UPI0003457051|nr:BadF/BadG/BcrA/BcrD ATPase family protein [Oscillatoria sp. PCC 10802]
MTSVLGIDGGGSKTVCVLMDETGKILGRGEAGASNYQTVGIETAGNSIGNAIAQAVSQETGFLEVGAICLGLAGVGRPEDIKVVGGLAQQLQARADLPVRWAVPPAGVVICNDCIIALAGGVGEPVGIVAIAGTGSIAYGQNRRGETKRAGGWGYILGDEGGGYDIALRGLRASVRSYDGRLGATVLTDLIVCHLGVRSAEDLVGVVYRRGWGAREIAGLAPLVGEAADAGDAVAVGIIDSAAEELVEAVRAVMGGIFQEGEGFEVVTAGGAWRISDLLRERFAVSLAAIAPAAEVIWPRYEPAKGAGLLALRAIGCR